MRAIGADLLENRTSLIPDNGVIPIIRPPSEFRLFQRPVVLPPMPPIGDGNTTPLRPMIQPPPPSGGGCADCRCGGSCKGGGGGSVVTNGGGPSIIATPPATPMGNSLTVSGRPDESAPKSGLPLWPLILGLLLGA
jgi:hypothetical protein